MAGYFAWACSYCLLLRNFILVIIIPAILAWLLANSGQNMDLPVFAAVYLFCSIAFFTLRYIDPRFDFPQAVVNKQQAFMQIRLAIPVFPSKNWNQLYVSFLKNTPQAITLSAVRPYPSDVHHLLSLAASVETELDFTSFSSFFIFQKKKCYTFKKCYFISVFSFHFHFCWPLDLV